MKKQRWLLAMLIAAALILAGCSQEKAPETTMEETTTAAPLTAEEILDLSAEAMEEVKSFRMNMELDMSMKYEDGEESQEIDMGMDMDMQVMTEPEQAHVKGSIDMMGISLDMETYSVLEDGKPVVYSGMYDTWTKAAGSEGSAAEDFDDMMQYNDFADQGAELTLSEMTTTFQDREVYEITTVLEGDLFGKMMESSMGMMGDVAGDVADMDYSQMSAETTLYVYVDDFRLAQISMDIAGMEEVAGLDSLGISVQMDRFHVSVSYLSFDDVTEIVVPEEVKSAAVEAEDGSDLFIPGDTEEPSVGGAVAQDDQGNYLLDAWYEEDDVKALVAMPEGFTFDEEYSDSTVLYFDKIVADPENHELYLAYTTLVFDDEISTADMGKVHQNMLRDMMTDSSYSDAVATGTRKAELDDTTIYYTVLSYTYGGSIKCKEYNCWMVGEGEKVIRCEVYEFAYSGECDTVEDEKAFISFLFEGVAFR